MSPGAWLTDMCQERYEVREKKSCKKVLSIGLCLIFLKFCICFGVLDVRVGFCRFD